MLPDRIVVALLLLPIGVCVISVGGLPFLLVIGSLIGLAAAEYAQLFQHLGLRPATWLVVGGTLALLLARYLAGFDHVGWVMTAVILIALAWYLRAYEAGSPRAASDFAVTLAGIVYLGWMGSYLVSLRALPNGLWWFLVALTSIWLGDAAAFSIGRHWGRHHMTPRLSPHKTWEGYAASVLGGSIGSGVLSLVWGLAAPANSGVTLATGLVLGGIIGALAPMGDLAISLLKREAGVKDSGNLLPGHGGVLDRIDSWIAAAAIGYYLVVGLVPLLH